MNTKTKWIAGSVLAACAIPAIAAVALPAGKSVTRAEAESKVRERFAAADTNHDGFLTSDEMQVAMAGKRDQRREMMFSHLDTNNDGSISRAEFDAAHGPGGMGHGPDGMKHGPEGAGPMHMGHGGGMMIMKMADKDGDGRVSLAEAVGGALAMFDRADTNHDKVVTAAERATAREAMRAQWQAKRAS